MSLQMVKFNTGEVECFPHVDQPFIGCIGDAEENASGLREAKIRLCRLA